MRPVAGTSEAGQVDAPTQTQNAQPAQAPSLLCDAGGCAFGDIGAEVERLVHKTAQTMARIAQAMEHSARQLEAKADQKHVEELRQQAMFQLAAGLTSAGTAMATSAVSVVSSMKELKANADALAAENGLEDAEKAQEGVEDATRAAENANKAAERAGAGAGRAEAWCRLASAVSDVQVKSLEWAASQKAADATESQNEAKRCGQAADDAKETRQAYEKLVERALDFYREWCQEKIAAERASLRA